MGSAPSNGPTVSSAERSQERLDELVELSGSDLPERLQDGRILAPRLFF